MTISLQSNAGNEPKETKVWSTILQEVRQTDTKKLPPNKSILVLGDNETGKTSLVAKMAGLESPKKGSGLEYNFIEIKDEYRDDSTKLGAWILDGDLNHVELLNFALTEPNFEHSCCLLVASMDQPWNIMRSLETWASVLEKHIEKLDIKPAKLKQCKQKILFKFLNYISPTDEAESKLVAGLNRSRHNTSKDDDNYQDLTNDNDDLLNETVRSANELDQNTLSRNLGIEVVVVISKTDYISSLEKEHDYTEETFDFIQQAIRKFCLQFGASLFYVSSKVNKNCDLLHKYLAHRIYDLPFKAQASVVDRDAIFVPAGWDNDKKISILYDNIRSANPDDDYNDFILERVIPGPTIRDLEVDIECDQEFLLRMQSELGKQIQTPQPTAPSPVQARQNTSNISNISNISNSGEAQAHGEGVLQNFFSSLLSKTRPTTTNGGGPPTQDQ